MPLAKYSLVVGRVQSHTQVPGEPHAYLHLLVGESHVSARVNTRSLIAPHTLMFSDHSVSVELSSLVKPLPDGIYPIGLDNKELALDYVRDYLMDQSDAQRIPYSIDEAANPVQQKLAYHLNGSLEEFHDKDRVYIWGNLDTENATGSQDSPYQLNDIHMNQGSRGIHSQSNGVEQDGALVFTSKRNELRAMYLAFASQCWDTDDRRGEPVGLSLPDHVIETDSVVRIVAAQLPKSQENIGDSNVTLINRSDTKIHLDRWSLENHEGAGQSLKGFAIGAGQCVQIPISPESELLKSRGGVLRLMAEESCVVHEVSYRETNPLATAWTLLFQ